MAQKGNSWGLTELASNRLGDLDQCRSGNVVGGEFSRFTGAKDNQSIEWGWQLEGSHLKRFLSVSIFI